MRSLVVIVAALLTACGPGDRGPSLIELSELGPRHLEVGDRVRVTGSGFPEGRPATVTLSGELRRAGEAPREGVNVVAPAQLVSPHALEFAVTPELASKLCGEVDARHTTFRGDVTVAFSPQRASGSTVTGRLSGVVVDVLPDSDGGQSLALNNDAQRFGRFLGMKIATGDSGVTITEVEPKQRAARGGLTPGDIVVELDGVVVRALTDLIPPPNEKKSEFVVRRGPDRLTLRVDVAGFRYNPPETLYGALLVLGFPLGLLVVLTSPLGRLLRFLERRVSERLRETQLVGLRARLSRSLGRSLLVALGQKLPSSFLPYFAFIAQSGTLALFALGKGVVVAELDLLLVPAATLSALLVTALFAADGGPRWSLRAGFARMFALLLLNVPLLAFVTAIAAWAGSLRPQDVVALQGAWPWQWALFQSPALGFLGVLSVLCLVPDPRRGSVFEARPRPTRRERFLDLTSWIHALAVTSVVALGVLGGFQSPFAGGTAVSVGVGATLSFFKSWSLIFVVAALRFALGPVDALGVRRLVALWLVAPAGVVLLAWLGLRRLSTGPVLGTLASALPELLCALFCTLVTLGIYRLAQAYRAPSADLGVQPWL